MPWKEVSEMSQRREFCELAQKEERNIKNLSKGFGISRTTAYKWLKRYKQKGVRGLNNKTKRPKHSPNKTPKRIENEIVKVRKKHPFWRGRKIKRVMENQSIKNVPAASTITEILKRKDLIDPLESAQREKVKRFEYEAPNELWQMDFKGPFKVDKRQCVPLTVLDDHSRYSIVLKANDSQYREVVMEGLIEAFNKYGLPRRMLMDNGGPWGQLHGETRYFTQFAVWLMDLGIQVMHGRPFHPQTQGKEERFHRTLKREVISVRHYKNLKDVQKYFDKWRQIYNYERPHEALSLEVPATRFRVSPRQMPKKIEQPEYDDGDYIRLADVKGTIHFKGVKYNVGRAFYKKAIALRPVKDKDGLFKVYYRHQKIKEIDLKKKAPAL